MMSRFIDSINGKFGPWWKKEAEKEVERVCTAAQTEAIVEADGAIRWKSNNQYVPDDVCEILEYGEFPFSRSATARKREIQVHEFINGYHSNLNNLSYEDKVEMRANFDPGTTIVDVINGDRIQI